MKRIFRSFLLLTVMAALTACGPSLEKRKEDSGIHYRLGVVHLNEKNFADALKELTTAIEMYPDEPSYHNALGLAYLARNMNKEAVVHMKQSIALDPKFSEAHVNLAAIYIVDKNWDGAIAESRAALSNIFYRTPELAYYNLGWAHYNKGEYPGALDSFKKAVEANGDYVVAYYNLGLTYDKMNSPKEAAEAFENAIKKAPGYVDAYFELGKELIKLRDRAGAEKAFRKVLEIAPQGERAAAARDYLNLLK